MVSLTAASRLSAVGIGADIESIDRFRHLKRIKDKKFLSKIFTQRELAYCFSRGNAAQHLAVRYAAKEAVVKALSGLGLSLVDYRAIEVVRQKNKAPRIVLNNKSNVRQKIMVSLSHSQDYALAFALATKR